MDIKSKSNVCYLIFSDLLGQFFDFFCSSMRTFVCAFSLCHKYVYFVLFVCEQNHQRVQKRKL